MTKELDELERKLDVEFKRLEFSKREEKYQEEISNLNSELKNTHKTNYKSRIMGMLAGIILGVSVGAIAYNAIPENVQVNKTYVEDQESEKNYLFEKEKGLLLEEKSDHLSSVLKRQEELHIGEVQLKKSLEINNLNITEQYELTKKQYETEKLKVTDYQKEKDELITKIDKKISENVTLNQKIDDSRTKISTYLETVDNIVTTNDKGKPSIQIEMLDKLIEEKTLAYNTVNEKTKKLKNELETLTVTFNKLNTVYDQYVSKNQQLDRNISTQNDLKKKNNADYNQEKNNRRTVEEKKNKVEKKLRRKTRHYNNAVANVPKLEARIVQLKESIDSGSKQYWVNYGAAVYRNATTTDDSSVDNSKSNENSETWLKDVNKAVSPKSSKYFKRLKTNSGISKKSKHSNVSSHNNANNNVQVQPKKSSYDYYFEGLSYFNQAKWDLDRDQFINYVQYQPNYRFGEATSKLSQRLNYTNLAIDSFKKAYKEDNNNSDYKIFLAAAYLMRSGFSLDVGCYNSPSGSYAETAKKSWDCNNTSHNNDLIQVIGIYNHDVNMGNENDELRKLAAKAYFYQGRIKSFQCNQTRCYTKRTGRTKTRFVCDPCWEKVIGFYDKSIELDSSFADVYQLRGAVHQHLGDGLNAKPDLNTARSMGFSKLSLVKYEPVDEEARMMDEQDHSGFAD